MARGIQSVFTEADRQAVKEATERSEQRTSGEIVSYVVERCDTYPEAAWKAAVLGSLAALLLAQLWHWLGRFWGGSPMLWVVAPALAGGIAGYFLAATFDEIRRRFVRPRDLERRTTRRAEAAFLEEEVFRTAGRTGILIFMALFEHRVIILADEGIHRQVEAEVWEEISDRLAANIRNRRSADGLIEAIEACGKLLETHGVERLPEDENELRDHLRLRDE